mgnify:CR=1 FL=1
MLIAVISHEPKPGQETAARARVDANTELMMCQPGILFRHTGMTAGSPAKIVTVTAWKDAASRAAWTAGSNSAIKMPIMVMTTNNSTRVKPILDAERTLVPPKNREPQETQRTYRRADSLHVCKHPAPRVLARCLTESW